MTKKLKIKLMPNGQIEMTTEGIKGKKCLEYLPLMEKISDIKIESQEFTSEYYEDSSVCYEEEQQQNISTGE